ncbi:MAG: ATP-binding protein [Gammaproteobacteria bacterium]|nr:ATP-binding protein [Gammaproteobacteria bacterium]MDH5802131.1 ATP-binding protein [Gammaproteobacteria bacterium]
MPRNSKDDTLLSVILDSIEEGVLVVDTENNVSHFNARFVHMWNIPETVINARDDQKTLMFVLDQLRDPQSFQEKVRKLYGSNRVERDNIHFKDGRVFDRYTRPLSFNRNLGRLWAFRDITNKVRADRELNRYKRNLEDIIVERTQELVRARDDAIRATKVKSDFLASMSHEIRTPLNSIMGFTSMLIEGYSGPITDKQRSQLELMNSSSNQLLNLVNNLLDLAKMEAGKMEIIREDFSLYPVLKELQHLFEPQFKAKGIQLNLNVDRGIGTLTTDRTKIRQILINLLGNAIKFTDQGYVTLHCERKQQGVFLQVEDTGQGMDNKLLQVIFQKYEQGKSAPQQGTGLGLAISKHYAELMGGSLTVTSAPGQGSIFTLYCPTTKAAANTANALASEHS